MKKIVAFAGSTSRTSINKQLVTYAASQLKDTAFDVLDMNDYVASIYSVDEEKNGYPESLEALSEQLKTYDGFIISLAEHNGSYAAAFKNVLDWLSRIDRMIFNNKPVLLMASSPGGRGGQTVLGAAMTYFPHMGANIIADFSLPNFFDNFKDEQIVNKELYTTFINNISKFEAAV